ncbi:TPA: hypothetical protein ACH3X2_000126 [Trebouxia sp. C0005]
MSRQGYLKQSNMQARPTAPMMPPRSIRLGYNVLLLDSDVIVFDDPYKYLKHPPFKDIVVINQEEAGLAPNGGVLYVQNAAPDGPAAFMFAEIVSRPLRWADDGWAHANRLSLHQTCMYADQDAYYDVLAAMVSGYMLFPKSWYCLDEVVRQDLKWAKASEEMEKHIRFFEAFKGVEHAAPDNWHNLTVEPTASLMTVDLRMPNCRGWPEELGGRWYPAERGRFSKELLQQLQDDCPDCLMWPDAEDASNAAAADKVPTEKFALMPRWLGTSYWLRGREGYWDASLTGGVAQQVGMTKLLVLHKSGVFFMASDEAQSSMVIGHTHYNPIGDTNVHRYVVPMSLGLYDWDLAQKAKGSALYTACASHSCSELKVLAFTPAMEGLLGGSASWQEFAFLLRGLAQLASLLGRAVAWPSLPCDTPWVNMGRQIAAPPLDLGFMWLPWTAADEQLMCTSWEAARGDCLSQGIGLLPWEWQHFQQQHRGNSSTDDATSIASEITLHAEQAAGAGVAEAGFNLVHHVVEINGADDPPGLKSLSNQPILFLDTLVHVDFESLTRVRRQSEAYQSLLGTCDLLNTTAMTHKYSFDSWNFATWQGLKIMDGPSVKANVADRPQDLKKGKLVNRLQHTGHTQPTIKHSIKKYFSRWSMRLLFSSDMMHQNMRI